MVRDKELSDSIPMPLSNIMKCSVASSGNDRFHAVVVGEAQSDHLNFSGNVRSLARGVGETEYFSLVR